jgi:hypothetical protein
MNVGSRSAQARCAWRIIAIAESWTVIRRDRPRRDAQVLERRQRLRISSARIVPPDRFERIEIERTLDDRDTTIPLAGIGEHQADMRHGGCVVAHAALAERGHDFVGTDPLTL